MSESNFYQQLRERVLAHHYHLQETWQTDGIRYVLEERPSHSIEHWQLWVYPEGQWAVCIDGDSIEEVFIKASQKGFPVDKLTLDAWHS